MEKEAPEEKGGERRGVGGREKEGVHQANQFCAQELNTKSLTLLMLVVVVLLLHHVLRRKPCRWHASLHEHHLLPRRHRNTPTASTRNGKGLQRLVLLLDERLLHVRMLLLWRVTKNPWKACARGGVGAAKDVRCLLLGLHPPMPLLLWLRLLSCREAEPLLRLLLLQLAVRAHDEERLPPLRCLLEVCR